MAKKTLDITRVFNHRKSIALVDTAEDLVDSLDNLSVLLRHIDIKYDKVGRLFTLWTYVCTLQLLSDG